MTLLPPGVKVQLAFGFIDVRKGIDGLAMLVQGLQGQGAIGAMFAFSVARIRRPISIAKDVGLPTFWM